MAKRTTCPDCGKGILGTRRYHPNALAAALGMSVNAACVAGGVSGSTQKDARCHGFTRNFADRLAVKAGYHPYEVWPEMADHDHEDATVPCAECGDRFAPTRKGHIYCTPQCGKRRHSRERMRRLYWSDPEHRRQRLEARQRLYAESTEYERARQRRYYHTSGEAERRKARYWSDPEYREQRIQEARDRRSRLREAS